MRILFFIMMLANAAFFAYAWFDEGARADSDAQIVNQQLNPQQIRLLAPEELSAFARKPAPPKAAAACLEWGALIGADQARAEQALAALALDAKLTQRKQEDSAGFWVYMPPLGGRQVATQKAAELKRLGVDEFYVVPDDPKWRFAISLGVYKTEEAAKARLAALRAKGVKSATVGAREAQPGKTWFQVRNASPALAATLNELQQGFPGTELHECAADEKKG